MPFWTYLLHCRGGMFYTGHTDNLDTRVAEHQAGKGGVFTRKYAPVKLVWSQEFPSRQEAFEAERRIKGWSRNKKLALIRGDWEAVSRYSRPAEPGRSEKRSFDKLRMSGVEVEISGIKVDDKVLHAIRTHSTRTSPQECCGILTGSADRITAAIPADNVHPSPQSHFEIDPRALITAHRAAREGGPEVLGYYHSHPDGPARPSAEDQAQASGDGRIWAIIGADLDVTLWRDDEIGFTPLSYSVSGG